MQKKNIRLTVVRYNVKAINFYLRLGFINCGEIQTDFGKLPDGRFIPEILMIKFGCNK